MKKIGIFLLASVFLVLSNKAIAFKNSYHAERPNIYAMFKTCANYITLVKNKKCPEPIIKRSTNSVMVSTGTMTKLASALKQPVTIHGFVLYTDNKEKVLNVDNMCQIGLFMCGSIMDTGFGGGGKACSSVCTRSKCKDPYIYYACKTARNSSDVLDGRKVCSNKSTEQCLNTNKTQKFDGSTYEKTFEGYNLSILEKLDKAQTSEDKKLLDWFLYDNLPTYVGSIQKDRKGNPKLIELNENEFIFYNFPESVQEEKLGLEKALKDSKLGSFMSALMNPRTPSENTKFGARHEKLWYDESIDPDIRKKGDELLRGLEPSQADTIKKIVTEMTTTGINAKKRLELLRAVVRLSKNNFGKKAKTYRNAVFLNGEKFELWIKISRKIPFLYNVEKRLQVIKSIDKLSDFQLLQVVRYNLFHEIYPDDFPKTGDLLEQIRNVKNFDKREDSTVPNFRKGLEIPAGTASFLLKPNSYSDEIEKIIVNYYKDLHDPDFVSPKGTEVYRLYNPNKQFKAFIKAMYFLMYKTLDFDDILRDRWWNGTKTLPEKGMAAVTKLKDMSVEQLSKLNDPAFLENLKKEIPIGEVINYTDQTTVKYKSYEDVLKKLEE